MTLLDTMPRRTRGTEAPARPQAKWRVELASNLTDITHAWLALDVSGVSTPYQTLGWQRAALATLDRDADPCLMLLRDASGAVAGLIPLVTRRQAGIRVATFAGGKHANYCMGLFRPDAMAAATAEQMEGALATAAAQAGIDAFIFRNQPRMWAGRSNPMALLPHQASGSSAWRAELMADPDAFIASLMSSESRKKLRHKERKLAEIGPVAYVEAQTSSEARMLLDAFLSQKKDRFRAMGIANPFELPEALAFLQDAAVVSLESGPPAPVTLHGLTVGERVAAVFGGAIHGGRYSGMFTSFDVSPDFSRYSPGDLLLLNLVRRMCARGLVTFDLGVGDSGYKSDYCPIREDLFDSFLPMTAKGRVLALAASTAFRLKTALAAQKSLLKPLRTVFRR